MREVYGRPVTGAREPRPRWLTALPARLTGLALLALLVYVIYLVLVHIRIAGG